MAGAQACIELIEPDTNQVTVYAHMMLANLGSDAYVLSVDLDEYLVTDKPMTLAELFDGCSRNQTAVVPRCASVQIQVMTAYASSCRMPSCILRWISGRITGTVRVRIAFCLAVSNARCKAVSGVIGSRSDSFFSLQDECAVHGMQGQQHGREGLMDGQNKTPASCGAVWGLHSTGSRRFGSKMPGKLPEGVTVPTLTRNAATF